MKRLLDSPLYGLVGASFAIGLFLANLTGTFDAKAKNEEPQRIRLKVETPKRNPLRPLL